jgi:hypothetical protein
MDHCLSYICIVMIVMRTLTLQKDQASMECKGIYVKTANKLGDLRTQIEQQLL